MLPLTTVTNFTLILYDLGFWLSLEDVSFKTESLMKAKELASSVNKTLT